MRNDYELPGYKRAKDSGKDCPKCLVRVKSHQDLETGEIIEKCHTCGRVYRDSMNRNEQIDNEVNI